MKKEQVLELMNAIPPDLIEEADIQAPVKRRRPGFIRTGLIAACLCLALVGTAAAVGIVSEISGIRLFWQNKLDVSTSSYTAEQTVTFFPIDTFSSEIMDLTAKYFHTWDEAEKFIGLKVADNPVLNKAQPYKVALWDGDYTGQERTSILLLPVFTEDGELKTIQVCGSYLIDGVWVRIYEFIYTEQAKGNLYQGRDKEDGTHPGWTTVYPKGSELSQETYTAPSGLTAAVVKMTRSTPEESAMCDAHFLINGVPFVVMVGTAPEGTQKDIGHMLRTLQMVLDGFEL